MDSLLIKLICPIESSRAVAHSNESGYVPLPLPRKNLDPRLRSCRRIMSMEPAEGNCETTLVRKRQNEPEKWWEGEWAFFCQTSKDNLRKRNEYYLPVNLRKRENKIQLHALSIILPGKMEFLAFALRRCACTWRQVARNQRTRVTFRPLRIRRIDNFAGKCQRRNVQEPPSAGIPYSFIPASIVAAVVKLTRKP